MELVNRERDVQGSSHRNEAWGPGAEAAPDDAGDDPLRFGTVILPARVDAAVARRIAIAADRDGIAIADLLGRAAAAFDWQVGDDSTERGPAPG